MHPMETALFDAALSLYAVSTALALAYVFSRNEALTAWMWRLLGIALAAHLLSFLGRTALFWRFPENRFFLPIDSFFGALSCLAFSNALVFWVIEGVSRLNVLGAFVLPWTFLAAGAAWLWADPAAGALQPALRSYWLNIHPLMLMASYTIFANGFGVGLALLIQERQIKSRRPTELCYRLPAIEDLDGLHSRVIAAAFAVLSAGMLLGSLWYRHEHGRFWSLDAKFLMSLLSWSLYGATLLQRARGLRGRRTVFLSMLAFASLLLTFFAGNYFSAKHGFLSGD